MPQALRRHSFHTWLLDKYHSIHISIYMHVCNAVNHPALTPTMQLELSLSNLHSPSTRFLISSASVLCVINRFRKQGRKRSVWGLQTQSKQWSKRKNRSKRKRQRMKEKYSSTNEDLLSLEGKKWKVVLVGLV